MRIKIIKLGNLAACLAAFAISTSAQAAIGSSTSGLTAGVHAGAGILGDSGGAHLNIGANGSFPFTLFGPFFIGGDFSYMDRGSISSSGNNASGSIYLLYGSLNYETSSYFPNSFIGVAMGVGWNHTTTGAAGTTQNSNTDTNFYVGPRAGADFPISSSFTVGGQADWLITPNNGAPNVLEALAVLKYWI
jgi:hypothetical protein